MDFVKSCQYECTTIGAGHLKHLWFCVTLNDGTPTRTALSSFGTLCNAAENFFDMAEDVRDEILNISIEMFEKLPL